MFFFTYTREAVLKFSAQAEQFRYRDDTRRPRTKRAEGYVPRFYVPVRFISERVTTNRTPPTHGFVGHLA
jgi:hypothetical protein